MSADTQEDEKSVSANMGIALMEPDYFNENVGSRDRKNNAHVPPALESSNNDAIWFEIVENQDWAKQAALELGWHDAKKMDNVAVIIQDDFSEFYLPLNSSNPAFEQLVSNLKDDYMQSVAKYNDDVVYTGDIKDIEVGNEQEKDSGEEVDWDSLMGGPEDEEEEEDQETTIEDDIEELFD